MVYNNDHLSQRAVVLALLGIGINFIFSFLSWIVYPKRSAAEKTKSTSEKTKSTSEKERLNVSMSASQEVLNFTEMDLVESEQQPVPHAGVIK